MHLLNYKFNDKKIANGVIWYYTKYIEVSGPKKPSAESHKFDARDRANKNVKAEKRSVPLHSCADLRQKPEMRRWRGNYLFGWKTSERSSLSNTAKNCCDTARNFWAYTRSAYGHRNFWHYKIICCNDWKRKMQSD